MNTSYRKATPQDVDIAVPLIYSTGPAAFEYVFKVNDTVDASRFLRYAFVRKGSEFSYDNHEMVYINDKPVGTIATYSGKDISSFTKKAIQYILSYYGMIKGAKVMIRGLRLEKIIRPPKDDTHYLAHVAVAPELRGKGIGTWMIKDKLEEGRGLGRPSASLDVSVENPRAQALYEQLGFKITQTYYSDLKHKYSYLANHHKMFIDLV